MAFPVTLNGRTYTLTDFEGTNYVDGLPDAFEDFVTHAGDIYNSTSTTSNSIGTGSKTFTVEANKPYQAGTPLRIADAAAPSTNFLDTVVTSYSGTTLVVNSIGYGGSGTKTSWTVNIGGAKTVDGTLGLSQGGTGATDAAGARTNIDVYSKSEADTRYLNISGDSADISFGANMSFGDNNKAIFGAGSDLQIYHDAGGDSYITESNASGQLRIQAGNIKIADADGNNFIYMTDLGTGGLVNLFHNGAEKLATSATGIDITGIADASTLFRFGVDNSEIANNYLRFKPSGSAFIDHNTVGQAINFRVSNASSLDTTPLVVNSTGVDITGGFTATADSIISTDGGNPSMTVKTSGTGNNPSYILRAGDNTVFDIMGIFSSDPDYLRIGKGTTGSVDTEIAKFHVGGDVEIANGNLVVASGHGIDFSATSGTGTSELLDDYEEGTWTPSVGGATTDPTITYTSQAGYYTKIGRIVHIQMYLQVTSISGGSGAAKINGIPFNCSNLASSFGSSQMEIFGLTIPSNMNNTFIRMNGGAGHFRLEHLDNRAGTSGGTGVGVAVTNLNNNFRIIGSFMYMV